VVACNRRLRAQTVDSQQSLRARALGNQDTEFADPVALTARRIVDRWAGPRRIERRLTPAGTIVFGKRSIIWNELGNGTLIGHAIEPFGLFDIEARVGHDLVPGITHGGMAFYAPGTRVPHGIFAKAPPIVIIR
jgi:hypothetical protein